MGGHKSYSPQAVKLRPSQRKRLDSSNITRLVRGGFEKITYKEVIDGVTYIRTKWRQKKKTVRKKRS